MKRSLLLGLFLAVAAVMMAIPAKRGLTRTLTLADGTTVQATLVGDEFAHFWLAPDGTRYQQQGKFFAPVAAETIEQKAQSRRRVASQRRQQRLARAPRKSAMIGQKKGLIILVEFSDVSFKPTNAKQKYTDIANTKGYTTSEGFNGSVSDYFYDQSNGQFQLTFDVVGPVKMDSTQAYYGSNDSGGNDEHAGEMVAQACKAIADSVNFKDYDWDEDGYVDQVFVLYAGEGEADGGSANTVWPHMYWLNYSDYGKRLYLDGVYVDTYACSNEWSGYYNIIEGIGAICHEFSHCLGYPDMYDINYGGNYGMGSWDLMCSGSYNGDSFVPAGYTAYEKMVAGWTIPVELTDSTEVTNMKPLSQHGQTYIIYNKAYKDEYYLLENRQQEKWDAELNGHGLLVTYVDYDQDCWEYNVVNTFDNGNDHQRITIVPADNVQSNASERYDTYPYRNLDSLTNTTSPAATLYHKNSDGKKFLNYGIYNITENSDGTISFNGRPKSTATNGGGTETGDYFFKETFDKMTNKGGNDDYWNGSIATIPMSDAYEELFDNQSGWDYTKVFLADQCVKIGTGKAAGSLTTPTITITDDTKLTFKAGTWKETNYGPTIVVTSSNPDIKLGQTEFTVSKAAWTDCETTITGTGSFTLTFENKDEKRFFLDEIMIPKPKTTGISTVEMKARKHDGRIYNMNGQYVGTDLNVLPRGLYIVNGRKILK